MNNRKIRQEHVYHRYQAFRARHSRFSVLRREILLFLRGELGGGGMNTAVVADTDTAACGS